VCPVSRVIGTIARVIADPARISGSRAPRAPTSRPDSGAKSTVIRAIGNVYSPACSGEYPRTSCR